MVQEFTHVETQSSPASSRASSLPDMAKVANQDDLSELELLMANQTAEAMKVNIAASTETSLLTSKCNLSV